jgi:hypothetical protein
MMVAVSCFLAVYYALIVGCRAVALNPCYDIDGGNWQLVRHAWTAWHPAQDHMTGTESYGNFMDDPEAQSDFSIKFDTLLLDTTEVLFSNGDCSEFLITNYIQVKVDPAQTGSYGYTATVLKSHTSAVSYDQRFENSADGAQHPMIFWENGDAGLIYAGKYNLGGYVSRFSTTPANAYVNVFLRGTATLTLSVGDQIAIFQQSMNTAQESILTAIQATADKSQQNSDRLDTIVEMMSQIDSILTAVAAAQSAPVIQIGGTEGEGGDDGGVISLRVSSGTLAISILVVMNMFFFAAVAYLWRRLTRLRKGRSTYANDSETSDSEF